VREGVKRMHYVLAYDIGTTGIKTCLFEVESQIRELCSENMGYNLYTMEDGGAEQEADEWWEAMCLTTKSLLHNHSIDPKSIEGISFCSQMQGLVLVDENGVPVRRPMSYMDQRAREEFKEIMGTGVQIAGGNMSKVLTCLKITSAAPLSVKDPVWKYKWVEKHEPENFKRVAKWLDVKDYLIGRCTGRLTMTEDSAYATLIYDPRNGKKCWSQKICSMLGVNMDHLPEIVSSTDNIGPLTDTAAEELGLCAGTPVFGGGGDASLIAVGSGCVSGGHTHIYSGTSGWVSTVVTKPMVDIQSMIAAIVGAQKDLFNYFAEMETAGKCLEWVRDHLALDEIGVYLDQHHIGNADPETKSVNLYDYMTESVKDIEPGAGGVLFTPWLHGNRCPFEDPDASGMFFGITLDTGKTHLIRAVLEGVCYHMRWMLECQDKKTKTSEVIRFSGGGALSDVTCQILADITGRTIEVGDRPQDAGSFGAAALIAVGLGLLPDMDSVRDMLPAQKVFTPDSSKKLKYDKYYEVFKQLYNSNKKCYAALASANNA